jgi:PHP family Zn ribbon phosphoesterase
MIPKSLTSLPLEVRHTLRIIADLHIHSKYSAATSEEMNLVNLNRQAKVKGLNLLGTGDNSTCSA